MKFSVILFEFSIAFLDLSRSKPFPPILSIVTPEPRIFEARVDIQLKQEARAPGLLKI